MLGWMEPALNSLGNTGIYMNKALEELQAGRDPLAPSPDESNSEFYKNVAKWCSWLPLLAGAFCFVVSKTLKDFTDGGHGVQFVRLCALGVGSLMILTSLILGLIALTGIRKCGTEGILKPAS